MHRFLFPRFRIKAIFENGSRIFSRRQSSIFSAAAILAVAFGISALLGIFRDRLLYAKFYACCADQLDAYNAAFRLPDIIFRLLVTGALSAAFIPVFSEQISKSKEKAYRMVSSVINILFLAFLSLSIIVIVFAYPLSRLIASGFSGDQILLMSLITRIMVSAQIFFLLSSFLTGILQTYQRFLIPALAPVVYNLGIILGIQLLAPRWGIFGPAIGVVIGSALHFLIQLPLVLSLGFRYSFSFSFRLLGVRKILRLMPPRTLALGLSEIEATLSLFLASSLPTGSLSLFYLGQRLTQFFSRIFGVTIGQACLPVLSKEASKHRLDRFRKTLLGSLLQALYLAFPAASIFLILRVPIVRLAYGSKDFPWQATIATGRIVACFAPLVIFNVINDILIRGFHALQDTKTPLLASFISLISVLAAALFAIFKLGLGIHGLAVAITLAGLIRALVLAVLLIKKAEIRDLATDFFSPILKMFFSSIVLVLTSWILLRTLDRYVFDTTRIAGLIGLAGISFVVGVFVYFVFTLALSLKEAQVILKLMRRIVVWPESAPQLTELPPLPE